MSSVNVGELVPLVELLLKLGVAAVEAKRQRPVGTMTAAEVRLAAHELLADVQPWSEPARGELLDD